MHVIIIAVNLTGRVHRRGIVLLVPLQSDFLITALKARSRVLLSLVWAETIRVQRLLTLSAGHHMALVVEDRFAMSAPSAPG